MDEKIFTYANLKSPFILIPALLLLGVGLFLIAIGIWAHNIGISYIGLAFIGFMLPFALFIFTAKIRLTESGIEYSSLFKSVHMSWKEIKAIGGYRQSHYTSVDIPLKELRKVSYWGQKFIYLSTEEDFYLKWGQKVNKTFMDFHYRPELLDLIENYLRRNSTFLANKIEKVL